MLVSMQTNTYLPSAFHRYFPFGIVFLVAGKILEMDDPSAMGKKLGFYAITVVMGLVLHGLFILPAMYFFITKKSPIVYIRGILQALLISLATSSRYSTCQKPMGCNKSLLLISCIFISFYTLYGISAFC